MKTLSAILVLLTGAAFLTMPLLARAPETDTPFASEGGEGIVGDAGNLSWTVRRLTSTIAAVEDAQGDWGVRVLLAISPREPATPQDAEAAARFVQEGGILIVADAFDEGNSLLAQFGLLLERARLVHPTGNLSTIVEFPETQTLVTLRSSTAIHVLPGKTPTILAWSPNETFIDLDGDGVIGSSEPGGRFPVIAKLAPENADGYVLAVADPTLFTSDAPDAGRFRRELLAQLHGTNPLLVVDETHGDVSNLAMRAAATVVRTIFLPPTRNALLVVGGVLVLASLASGTRRTWLPHQFRPERFVTRGSLSRVDDGAPPPEGPVASWTTRGVAALAGGSGLLLLGVAFHNAQATYAGGFLLVAASTAMLLRRASIDAELLIAQPKLQENVATEVAVRLNNQGRRPRHLEVRVALPSEFEVGRGTDLFQTWVPGHDAHIHEFQMTPAVRGPYELGPLQSRTQDPLRLRQEDAPLTAPIPVRVTPTMEPLRTLPFGTRVPMITMGPHVVNRTGQGVEFHSLRDYQLGDSIRIVNWKASARSKDLIVNQRVHETMTHLTIIIDGRAVSAAGPADATPIARLARAVASVASAMLRVRDRIRVYIYGHELVEMPAATGSRQLDALLEALASLRPGGSMPFMEVAQRLAPMLRPKMPVLVATGAEADPTLADGMRLLTNIGALPLLVTAPVHVSNEEGLTETQKQAIVDEREAILNAVRGVGVPVHALHPGVALESQFRLGGAS